MLSNIRTWTHVHNQVILQYLANIDKKIPINIIVYPDAEKFVGHFLKMKCLHNKHFIFQNSLHCDFIFFAYDTQWVFSRYPSNVMKKNNN